MCKPEAAAEQTYTLEEVVEKMRYHAKQLNYWEDLYDEMYMLEREKQIPLNRLALKERISTLNFSNIYYAILKRRTNTIQLIEEYLASDKEFLLLDGDFRSGTEGELFFGLVLMRETMSAETDYDPEYSFLTISKLKECCVKQIPNKGPNDLFSVLAQCIEETLTEFSGQTPPKFVPLSRFLKLQAKTNIKCSPTEWADQEDPCVLYDGTADLMAVGIYLKD